MRNIKLIDLTIQLHDIAREVLAETGDEDLSHRIRVVADDLHVYSINDDRANEATKEFIARNLGK
jgi:hypothetical protein